jgi:hypothetical protein
MTFHSGSIGRGARALGPAGSSRSRAYPFGLHETVEMLRSMAHSPVPSTRNQKRVVGCVNPSSSTLSGTTFACER